MLHFKFLTGDVNWQDYGGKFVSKRLNNGDWDYWFVMEVINWHEHDNDPDNTYHVQLCAVSPDAMPEEEIQSALNSSGVDTDNPPDWFVDNDLAMVEVVSSHMGGALIWQESGNNVTKLMKQARKEASDANSFTFGFVMDRPQNAIGSTGWDVISGDILAGLYK